MQKTQNKKSTEKQAMDAIRVLQRFFDSDDSNSKGNKLLFKKVQAAQKIVSQWIRQREKETAKLRKTLTSRRAMGKVN